MDEDLIDHTNDNDGIFDNISNIFRNIRFGGCFGSEDYYRTAGDDLRDIANSLLNNNDHDNDLSPIPDPIVKSPIMDNIEANDFLKIIDVKIKLGKFRNIIQIMVKYVDEKRYVNVPFELSHNPTYIQNIINNWFIVAEESIYAKPELFDELEKYYQNSKRNRNTYWFEKRAEWIKFSYIDSKMRPCGFKKFQNNSEYVTESDISELSEN